MSENIKGAFKNFPEEQRPVRIPTSIYDSLASYITSRLGSSFEHFVPSVQKTNGKDDTGDLDVFLNPVNRNTWQSGVVTGDG